ncbi:[NiFe]-hydrogenase assembly chaperone HybE [Methylocystis suflitae]|uniref:[NiFe]-hydrogenase assembly chaperone HybE n=1 Tax=Methylocystis suflitae TaxID=2951405 RepID=UPI00210D0B8E|nr:[NiFe]-hydrogenase assembly chaperone HybE [Methylocystis suflitae]MCQ4188618.1 [NiFe]-hydrogenase assembly chaperone HybE [Methylocystis suflitae]
MSAKVDPAREAAAACAGARLADHYRRVHEAMRDLPICNPALEIEAIGFRPYGAQALGVILTPWFMNLMICAADAEELPPKAPGETACWPLTAGRVDFVVGRLEGFGRVDSCSLFSPMDDFADHAAARAVAVAALDELFDPAFAEARAAAARRPALLDRRSLTFGAKRDAPNLAS